MSERRSPLAGLGADLRGAWRALAARPGHALAIVLTLALALGASTAIYSAVDAVLVRALPYPDTGAARQRSVQDRQLCAGALRTSILSRRCVTEPAARYPVPVHRRGAT